jgi:hypothetical protein
MNTQFHHHKRVQVRVVMGSRFYTIKFKDQIGLGSTLFVFIFNLNYLRALAYCEETFRS